MIKNIIVEDGFLYYGSAIIPIEKITMIDVIDERDYKHIWNSEWEEHEEVADGYTRKIIINTSSNKAEYGEKVKEALSKEERLELQKKVTNKIWGKTSTKKYM